MNNEKIDSILKLSLETEEMVRMKSDILGNGYDEQSGLWEVIIKYHGDISDLRNRVEFLEILISGYAIMLLSQSQLEDIIREERIEYAEMPKEFAYNVYRAKQRSCILPLTTGNLGLSGRGVLIAVLDSGIDYLLRDFQNEKGSRILYLWDQTLKAEPENGFRTPEGFYTGVEFTKEEMDGAIYEQSRLVPTRDITGHGTAVAGIAAGSAVSPLYRGIAPESDLLIVKLGGNIRGSGSQNFPLTTDIMRGISYVIRKAEELERPLVINLSFGDTYGAHDGSSLLERFINAVSGSGRTVICIGSGNEAVTDGHAKLCLLREERVELAVADRERSMNVQIWKSYVDEMELELLAPGGERYAVNLNQEGKQVWIVGGTRVLIYVSPPTPYSVNEEIFLDFIPVGEFVDEGIWTFVFRPLGENQEELHLFLPNAAVRNAQTKFLQPSPYLSMTIPAYASGAITVGAYDTTLNSQADFSGRDREIGERERLFFAADIKPDIVAPGVDITAPVAGGGYGVFTGTSFAAPIVTGGAALLMEWGIVQGNDRFLYGEKLKAYIRKGARPLLDAQTYPNVRSGWGALCLQESLPE